MTSFNLADLFERVADAIGDREAVVCGERRLTFAQLDERATRLAHVLAGRGIGPGDHVGLHLYNSTEYLEGMLAAFKLRAVPVNVNYRYVADELRYLFDDADVGCVIHEEDLRPVVDGVRRQVPSLRHTIARGDEYEALLAAAPSARTFAPRSGDDLYILYTGGTTGRPKGVMWRHEDVFAAAFGGEGLETPDEVVARARTGRTRCLTSCPFMHGTAHWMAFSTLYAGGTVVVAPGPRLDPDAIWDLVEAEEVTYLVIVGDAFALPLVEALGRDSAQRWDLSSLTAVLSGGAILSPAVKNLLLERLPGVIVVDGFGASETGGQGQMVAAPGVPVSGRPRFRMGADTFVVDDSLRPVTPGSGTVGRVARRGHVPLGYYNDPAKSAATFPVVDGQRLAVVGDLATVDRDGTVVLLGRGSMAINSGGEKVFPEEVESSLKAHPSVFDAIVVGVADERWGQRVTAVVSLRPGAVEPTLDELADHCRATLAGFKVPRSVVVVPTIVRSPSGKPDYRWARDQVDRARA
ncbi:MAG TPA: acyl-CoA synthetase [Acidimicrobiales bacterium]|nr:acyl-CoA synthetase [Acidimicrobiales bacterium]